MFGVRGTVTAMMAAVVVEELVKDYRDGRGRAAAVDGVSFNVQHGEVFGLLGPNGAGKTTAMGVLTTRVLPTSGTVRINGFDPVVDPIRARERLAVVPQRNNLDRSLNARQNLTFHARYHGLRRNERNELADELLHRMGLVEHAEALIDRLSGGQAQRLLIARALMHRPDVLFLDEPSTGLDPQARLFVHERIKAFSDDGIAVVLCTHDMDEAAKVCDRVGIVDHGKLLALDTPSALTGQMPGRATLTVAIAMSRNDHDVVARRLGRVPGVQRVEGFTAAGEQGAAGQQDVPIRRFRLYTDAEAVSLIRGVVAALDEFGYELTDMSPGRTDLEDVFIRLTGRELR